MRLSASFLVFSLCCASWPSAVPGQTGDHPVIKPLPRSQIVSGQSHYENFALYSFRVQKNRKQIKVKKSGRFWSLRYLIKDASGRRDKSLGREEIIHNYMAAAQEKGGTILYKTDLRLTFTIPRQGGGTTWADISAGKGSYNLFIIDEAGFNKQLNFGAEEMRKNLKTDGRVVLYGIHFDTDKATLRPGAEKTLTEIVKMLQREPGWKIEIQGHTDNTGPADHNRDLSQQRAETVQAFLLLYGIDKARLTPRGLGETMPVDSNETSTGRAQNRRVELVVVK